MATLAAWPTKHGAGRPTSRDPTSVVAFRGRYIVGERRRPRGSRPPCAPDQSSAGSAFDRALCRPPPSPLPGSAPASSAVQRPRKTGWRRWLPLAGVISFIAACAIAMLLILGFSNGIAGLAIGLVAAILPVPVLVGCFLWLDRYEPEPTRYLVFCFAWGASVATLVALGVNTGGAWLFDRLGLPDALVAVLVAPFIEESMKALGPILLLWRRRREWSGITDGIVYCGLSAIGFAMVENVLYLGGHGYAAGADQYGPATGIQNVFLIFIVRILFTGFAHPLFTSMTGVGLGPRRPAAGDRRVKWLAPIAGLLLAMILHGTFNLLPTLSVATGEAADHAVRLPRLHGPVLLRRPSASPSRCAAGRGGSASGSCRTTCATGWFAPPEVAALGSLGRRHSARRWAKRVAGDAGLKAMRGVPVRGHPAGDPARRHAARAGPQAAGQQRSAEEEQRLLTAIVGYRSVFAGRDPQMPQAFWDGASYRIAFPDGVTRTVGAPVEPVVPVPVRMAPQPAMAWSGGYGPPVPTASLSTACLVRPAVIRLAAALWLRQPPARVRYAGRARYGQPAPRPSGPTAAAYGQPGSGPADYAPAPGLRPAGFR